MINEAEHTDLKIVVFGAGLMFGMVLAVVLSACSSTPKDAGIEGSRVTTVTTATTATTSTKTK